MKRARFTAFAVLLLALSACSRGLTPAETDAAHALFGDTLDTRPVRVMAGLGITPLPRPPKPPPPDAAAPAARAAPKGLCVRHRSTGRYWAWPAAFTLENDIYFSYRFYAPDAFAGFPESVPFPASLVLAHELTHVWQWQNRARTHYTVRRSAGETVEKVDPYYFKADPDAAFLKLGFEQQGALVQDFVCYALFAPDDPELGKLAAVLRPVLPVDAFLAELEAARRAR